MAFTLKRYGEEADAPTFTSLTFPVTLREISKFEKENENKGITVHVYAVHEWRDRKTAKKKSFLSDSDISKESISTMSDSESDSEPEEEMAEEDGAILDEHSMGDDFSMGLLM